MKKRRLILIILSIPLVLLLLAGGGWLLTRRRPAYYRPRGLTPIQRDDYRKDLENTVALIHNESQRGEAFLIEVDEDRLNGWIEAMIEEMGVKRPPEIGVPVIALRKDRMIVAFELKHPYLEAVISIDLTARIRSDGQLKGGVSGIRVGALPVPVGLIESYLDRIEEKMLRPSDPLVGSDSRSSWAHSDAARIFLYALRGEPIPAEYKSSGWRMRVSKIELLDGVLRIWNEPVTVTVPTESP